MTASQQNVILMSFKKINTDYITMLQTNFADGTFLRTSVPDRSSLGSGSV